MKINFHSGYGLPMYGTSVEELHLTINDEHYVVRESSDGPALVKWNHSTDAEALDALNLLLSAPEWPGASGMEDVCEIVRSTGRTEIEGAPAWGRH